MEGEVSLQSSDDSGLRWDAPSALLQLIHEGARLVEPPLTSHSLQASDKAVPCNLTQHRTFPAALGQGALALKRKSEGSPTVSTKWQQGRTCCE